MQRCCQSVQQKIAWGRALIVVGWVGLVCSYYVYYYVQHIYAGYPVLRRFNELGIWEMIRRYFTP